MPVKVKPLFILGKGDGLFWHQDGSFERIGDQSILAVKQSELAKAIRVNMQSGVMLLNDTVLRSESDVEDLRRELFDIDVLLAYVIGAMSPRSLLALGVPIVAFSGQHTPALALYMFGVERQNQRDLAVALDYAEIDQAIRRLHVKTRLRRSRVALLGFPPSLFSPWHDWPDLEAASEKLGVAFVPFENREIVARIAQTNVNQAENLAEQWMRGAKAIVEPGKDDVIDAARLYLALSRILEEMGGTALAINCLDLMRSLKIPTPCYAMSKLQDDGVIAACESDVIVLLSMMIMSYLAGKPPLMGNIVSANPESNVVMVSHCVVPSKMAGFESPSSPYTLRNYHGVKQGLTAHVDLPLGQRVTVGRLARTLDRILITSGEISDCRDTVACRTSLSIRIGDVRRFVQRTFGNHHALVYGDHVQQTVALAEMLGMEAIEV